MTGELVGDLFVAASVLIGSGLISHTITAGSRRVADATDRTVTVTEHQTKYVQRVAVAAESVVNERPVQQENARLEAMNRHLSGAALAILEGDTPVENTMREDVATGVTIGWQKAAGIMGDAMRSKPGS